MAITLVKSAEGTSTSATTTAAFASAPATGNTVGLFYASDDYNGTPDSGWTQPPGAEQQTWHGLYGWHRQSTGANSFPYTIGSATNSSWILLELSGVDATTPVAASAGNNAIDGNGTWALPSITPPAGDYLLVAIHGSSMTSGDASADATTWSNSFGHVRTSGPASGTGTYDVVTVATRQVTADGATAYTTTVTRPWAGKQSATGIILAFKAAAGGGADGTANGSTLTATGSLSAGTATGTRNPTALGATLTAAANLIAGSASAANGVVAPGATLTAPASLLAGSASAVRNETASGAIVAATASLSSGGATGNVPVLPPTGGGFGGVPMHAAPAKERKRKPKEKTPKRVEAKPEPSPLREATAEVFAAPDDLTAALVARAEHEARLQAEQDEEEEDMILLLLMA